MSACDRTSIVHNRYTNRDVETIMFGSNSYLGATVFPAAIEKTVEVTRVFGIGSGGVPLLTGPILLFKYNITTFHSNSNIYCAK